MHALFSNLFELIVYVVIPFIVMLGILIFAHEFGHFITAVLSGVKVETFALGFGPWLFRRKRGDTEFGIKAFPLGGYVKVLGDPSEMEDPETEVPPEEMHRALFNKPVWKKLSFFAAGSIMNLVLAFAVAPFVYIFGIEKSYYNDMAPCNVGYVQPDSPAEKAGIIPGDRIVRVGEKDIANFEELRILEALNPEKTLKYGIQRGNTVFEKDIKLAKGEREPIGYSGILEPEYGATIGGIIKDFPAKDAGLKEKDRIISINGKNISYWREINTAVQEGGGKPMTVEVIRDGNKLAFDLTPKYMEDYDKYLVGIRPYDPPVLVRYGFIESCRYGFEDVIEWTVMTLEVVKKLFTLELSVKSVMGPAGIAGVTGAAAHLGISHLIRLLALISLNLGILNLLPIPPLDGAHFLITSIEAVIRREMKMKWKEYIFRAGFAMLLVLIVLITFNDIIRFKDPILEWFKEIGKGFGLG